MSSLSGKGGFLEYVRRSGGLLKIIIPAALGLLLLFVGTVGFGDGESAAPTVGEESSVCELCSQVEGAGECRVMITRSDSGEAVGVVVLCEGADSPSVRLRITELLRALLGVGANRIRVEKISQNPPR